MEQHLRGHRNNIGTETAALLGGRVPGDPPISWSIAISFGQLIQLSPGAARCRGELLSAKQVG